MLVSTIRIVRAVQHATRNFGGETLVLLFAYDGVLGGVRNGYSSTRVLHVRCRSLIPQVVTTSPPGATPLRGMPWIRRVVTQVVQL
eukprot:4860584-Prymnesium_polylepis.1